MRKPLIATLATVATLLAAGAAHAGSNVYWSIGINAPPIGTVISNAPVYAHPPVVYAPPQVVYAPPPVVYQPAPRVVYPAPVVIGRPVPIGYGGWGTRQGYGDIDRDGVPNRYDRYDNRHDNRYDHRGRVDRDRDGIPDYRDRRDDRKYRY